MSGEKTSNLYSFLRIYSTSMTLYFAPINLLSNYVYRHLVLECGADYVFSELILVRELDKAEADDKFKYFKDDLPRTVVQIGVSTPEEVKQGVLVATKNFPGIPEVNINMGCPQSTMQQTKICGGLLLDIPLMGQLAKALAESTKEKHVVGSIKLRLGTDPETILIDKYIQEITKNGINKLYIHARTLRHGYDKPTRYEFFKDLRQRYPGVTLVFNGDVDSPERYQEIGGGEVLVARAGLSNPLLFQDIKHNLSYGEGSFDPWGKDPTLIREHGEVKLGPRKIALIRRYVQLASQENLRIKLVSANLTWLLKGVSGARPFFKELNQLSDSSSVQEVFEQWLTQVNNA